MAMRYEQDLLERAVERNTRICRCLSYDSSPQGGRDYLNAMEERMTRTVEQTERLFGADFNPFGGFDYSLRTLPVMTLGRGCTGLTHKLTRVAHMGALQAGKLLKTWRCQVKHCVSDQSTERKNRSALFPDGADARDMFQKLLSGEVSFAETTVQELAFLPNCLETHDLLHIFFNALQTAIETLPEWKEAETYIRALISIVGNPDNKRRALRTFLLNASPFLRQCVHRVTDELIDWRWETLEDVLFSLVVILEEGFYDVWDAAVFGVEPTTSASVTAARRCEWFSPFCEALSLVCTIVGKEARTLEGCFCHADILHSNDRRTARRLLESSLGRPGACPWQGKWGPALALGYGDLICARVRNASSVRYQKSLFMCGQMVAARMAHIVHELKTRWCDETAVKLAPRMRLPYLMQGAFGQYMGYTKHDAKECTRKCFQEFNAIHDERQKDKLMCDLLGRTSLASLQLESFCTNLATDLHKYPDAFLDVQELAFPGAMGWALRKGVCCWAQSAPLAVPASFSFRVASCICWA
jgi:hypothetical protein